MPSLIRIEEKYQITTTIDDEEDDHNHNNNLFSRIRFRGGKVGGGARMMLEPIKEENYNKKNNNRSIFVIKTSSIIADNNSSDSEETETTVESTDDEDSFTTSSFDEIDLLLSRPVIGMTSNESFNSNKIKTTPSSESMSSTTVPIGTETGNKTIAKNNTAGESTDSNAVEEGAHHYDGIPIDSIIQKCLNLLSNNDIDQNRLGLQRLELLIKGGRRRKRSSASAADDDDFVSKILVCGGPMGSKEEMLRYVFATMICDSPHEDLSIRDLINKKYDDDDDESVVFDDEHNNDNYYGEDYFDDYLDEKDALFDWIMEYDPKKVNFEDDDNYNSNFWSTEIYDDEQQQEQQQQDAEEEDDDSNLRLHPEGKTDGVLHTQALRILSNALEKIVFLSSSSQNNNNEKTNNLTLSTTAPPSEEEKEGDDEELTSSSSSSTLFGGKMIIWKNIIRSLLNNIIDHPEQNTNATGYSLRILRLLYELEKGNSNNNSNVMLPLLQRSLFAQLSYLVEFGEHYRFPMIQTEASYLFNNVCSKRKGRIPSDDTVRVRINNFTTFYRIYDNIADRRLHVTRSDEIVSPNKNEYVYIGGR